MIKSFKVSSRLLTISFLFFNIEIADAFSEKCKKNFEFKGKVTTQNNRPIGDVKITIGDNTIAITDKNGNYIYRLENTRTWFSGRHLQFEKKGYESAKSSPFKTNESGPNVCGEVRLVRDMILLPSNKN